MKRRIALFILAAVLLTGCQEKEPTIQERKQQVFDNGIVFDKDTTVNAVQDKSIEYKNLFNKMYDTAIESLQYNQDSDSFTCGISNVEDYRKIVQQDSTGFQKDYENMLKLELSQDTIDNYIYSYVTNALGACGKQTFNFTLELGKSNSYSSNTIIVDEIVTLIDDFYSSSINYTKNSVVEDWVEPSETLEMGVGKVLLVTCKDKQQNCFVRVDSYLKDEEAENFIRGLSSINSSIAFPQNIIVVNYTVMNLGTETVTFEDKIVSTNTDGNLITYNSNDIIGLEYAKNLEPKIETTITNMYVVNDSGVLLWYDEGTKTSLKVNILSN